MNTRKFGKEKEQEACNYLEQQGLKLKDCNFTCKVGEVDLIMHDKDALVFVEVRVRNNNKYGGAVESVTYSKQQKITKTALFYLQKYDLLNKLNVRFDVIGFEGRNKIVWIKNAF